MKSKPTWLHTLGCSATSAFFVFGVARTAATTEVGLCAISKRETYHVHRWWVGYACDHRLGCRVLRSRLLSPRETESYDRNLYEKESPSWVAKQT